MIKVVINAKTGDKTVTDLGPHPKDYDWLPELAKMLAKNIMKEMNQRQP